MTPAETAQVAQDMIAVRLNTFLLAVIAGLVAAIGLGARYWIGSFISRFDATLDRMERMERQMVRLDNDVEHLKNSHRR